VRLNGGKDHGATAKGISLLIGMANGMAQGCRRRATASVLIEGEPGIGKSALVRCGRGGA